MDDIQKFYEFLEHTTHGWTEIRAISPTGKIESSFHNHYSSFCEQCDKLNTTTHVYAGVNPRYIKSGKNDDVKIITNIVFDIEYDHPKNTMITAEQLEYTLNSVDKVFSAYKYENLYVVMTGNGIQVHFKLKPTEKSPALQIAHKKYVEYFRSILPENIRIDMLCDPARIVRVPGTYNIKGGQKRLSYIWKDGSGRCPVFLNKFFQYYKESSVEENKPKDVIKHTNSVQKMEELIDKYPCYKHLYRNVALGGEHHHTACRLIAFFKKESFNDDEILEALETWDDVNDRYEGTKMLSSLIFKQKTKLYNYCCTDGLLKKYCNQADCILQNTEDEYVPVVNIAEEAENYLEATADRQPETKPELTFGWDKFDRRTWGLKRGELTVLAAYTSVGKTAAACQISAHNAQKGVKVLYISTEGKYYEMFNRMLSNIYNIDSFHFRNGWFTKEERETLKSAKKDIKKWSLCICDIPRPTQSQVSQAVKVLKPDIVILDYLQRCSMNGHKDRVLALQDWMIYLKTIAQQYNCATIALSQLRRKQDDADPNLGHLLGSSAIEQEGDNVILMYVKSTKKEVEMEENKSVYWMLAKGRNIGTGKMLFNFVGRYARFLEIVEGNGEMKT